jgi:hypothetical protein
MRLSDPPDQKIFCLCSLTAGEVVLISQMNNGFHVQPWPCSAPQQPQANNEFKFGPSQFTGFRTSFATPCDANAQCFNSCFNKPCDQEIITETSSIAPGIAQKREREQEDNAATSDKKQRRLRDAILLERKHAEALQTSLELHRTMVESYKSTCGAMDDEAQAMFKECLLELVDRWRRVVGGVYVFE